MHVLKFGGTSVGSAAAIRQTAEVIRSAAGRGPIVVVVSALSGVTDALISAATDAKERARGTADIMTDIRRRHQSVCDDLDLDTTSLLEPIEALREVLQGIHYLREITPRSYDFVLSHGELLSSRIIAAHLSAEGLSAQAVTGWDAGIVTDNKHGEASVLDETYDRIPERLPLDDAVVPIVTGFLAQTVQGERTTLGRGGSDYTAAILGRALGAKEIQIWTDVDGILSADPRIVPTAFSLEEVTFEEAAELAFFGAKVIHPKTIEPAVEAGVPVRVLNTFNPSHAGTQILAGRRKTTREIVALATKKNNTILTLESTRMLDAEGYLATVFDVLKRHCVSVDAIATSEVSICMTVEHKYDTALQAAAAELEEIANVDLLPGRAVICAVGSGMRERPGTAAGVFSAMKKVGINIEMISMGSSKINLTFVVKDEDADKAMLELHSALITG